MQEEALTVAVKNDALDLTEVYDGAVRDRKAVIEAAKMPTCLKQAGLAATVVEGRRTDDIGVAENIGERAKSSEPCDESGFKLGGSQSSASAVIQLEWKVGAAEEREYMIAVAEAKRAHNRQGPSKKSRQRDGASVAEGAIGATGSGRQFSRFFGPFFELAVWTFKQFINMSFSNILLGLFLGDSLGDF